MELFFEKGNIFMDDVYVLVVGLFEEIRELFLEVDALGGEEVIFWCELGAFMMVLFILELQGEFVPREGFKSVF